MSEVITYGDVSLELPFTFVSLEEVRISQELNDHATAYLSGIVEEDKKSEIESQVKEHTLCKILLKDEAAFTGVPADFRMKYVRGLLRVELELISMSTKMDTSKKKRSFQNLAVSYGEIIESVVKEYGGYTSAAAYKSVCPKAPVIQYEETDWEFIRRMASHAGTYILPDVASTNPNIYVGEHNTAEANEQSADYVMQRNLKNYQIFKENGVSCSMQDYELFELESLCNYQAGSKINYQGRIYTIIRKEGAIDRGAFVFVYTLQAEQGTRVMEYYNENIQGVSINGKVLEVSEGYKLKIHLFIDDKQESENAYAYQFATPYASEGTTGWYAMPEAGEIVSLFIPSNDERKAYITKVSQKDGSKCSYTADPTTRYMGIPDKSELKITKQEIKFELKGEGIYLSMSQDSGVTVSSKKEIDMMTEDDMSFKSSSFSATAKGKINLTSRQADAIIDRKVHFTSAADSSKPLQIKH